MEQKNRPQGRRRVEPSSQTTIHAQKGEKAGVSGSAGAGRGGASSGRTSSSGRSSGSSGGTDPSRLAGGVRPPIDVSGYNRPTGTRSASSSRGISAGDVINGIGMVSSILGSSNQSSSSSSPVSSILGSAVNSSGSNFGSSGNFGGGSNYNNGGGRKKSGCLKYIIIAMLIIAALILFKSCTGGLLGGSTSSSSSSSFSLIENTPSPANVQAASQTTAGVSLLDLLTGYSEYFTGSDMSSYYDYYGQGGSSSSGQGSVVSGYNYGSSGTSSSASSTAAAASMSAVSTSVAKEARDKYVTPVGKGKDVVTIMIYMCGTDLESKYGMATSDLSEIAKASISDKVNIIVETGGCKKWQNSIVSNSVNEIYQVKSGGLKQLEKNFGKDSMTDPDNLTSFIKYCNKNFPADRNFLIMWDHGGGSISGFGYDEKQSGNDTMNLSEISSALKKANCKFDCIGFDACLMATLETAIVCSDYADYLIASEESEPGTGWYYTSWVNALSNNTSIPTVELSKVIIDDYVTASRSRSSNAQVTLSVVDLAELDGTLDKGFKAFASSTADMVESGEYNAVSSARSGVRQFASSSRINQIDLIDLCNRLGTSEANNLASILSNAIKYNKTTISRAYGLSIYFPYESLRTVNSAISALDSIGMDSEYTRCIGSFASIGQGGQTVSSASQYYGSSGSQTSISGSDLLEQLFGGSGFGSGSGYGESTYGSYGGSSGYGSSYGSSSPLDALFGGYSSGGYSSGGYSSGGYSSGGSSYSDYSDYFSSGAGIDLNTVFDLLSAFSGRSMPEDRAWVNTDVVARNADYISNNYLNPGDIYIQEKNGTNVVSFTDAQWDLIQNIEVNLFIDDGEGYMDMGLDNVFEIQGNDLIAEYDGIWPSVNGHAVAYYFDYDTENGDGSWTTVGRIPAKLNGEPVYLQVIINDDGAYISGAYPFYANGETEAVSKGLVPVFVGDEIQFICDYYKYDGTFDAMYNLGEPFVVDEKGLEFADVQYDNDYSVCWRITDNFCNYYWTPAVEG